MNRSGRRVFAVALAALAVALGGCGGGSGDFKKDYTRTDQKLRQLGVDLGAAIRTANKSTDVKLATRFNDFASRARSIVSDLGGLKPPSKVKNEVTQLRSSLTVIAGDMTAVANALRAHNANTSKLGTLKLIRDAAPVRTASQTIRQKEGIKRTGG